MAKRLRRELTFAEALLWTELRKLPLHARKQSPVGPYVADFVIHRAKLVIEVDGYYHTTAEGQVSDLQRDAWFEEEGFKVVRFTTNEVVANPEDIAQRVLALSSRKGA